MPQTKKAKKDIVFGCIFAVIAIFFAIMFYLNTIGITIIKALDLYLAVTYVSYFVGLSMFFNAAYCKEKGYQKARIISTLVALAFTIAAIALLIYGFAAGKITMFN